MMKKKWVELGGLHGCPGFLHASRRGEFEESLLEVEQDEDSLESSWYSYKIVPQFVSGVYFRQDFTGL